VASWRWVFAINVPLVAVTLALVAVAVPARMAEGPRRHVDWIGALLCATGLAGPVFALIRQPDLGWSHPGVLAPLLGGLALLAAFVGWEARSPAPMLPLGLFRRRNFAVGNVQTLAMYGGLSIVLFFLVLFLQQVAGYSGLEAGAATIPITVVMFLLSKRAGALADRYGPRLLMGIGPLVCAAGVALLTRLDEDVRYVTDLLPALLLFALGLSATVAPLTATVLADADEHNAGIASGVNNAIARVAGLVTIAAIGAVVAASFTGAIDDRLAGRDLSAGARVAVDEAKARTLARADLSRVPAAERAAVDDAVTGAALRAWRTGIGLAAGLVALGGVLGLVGLRAPRRDVPCVDCAGGQLAGQPLEAARGEALAA
jgi:predicted MFS family arabinose efflux permease